MNVFLIPIFFFFFAEADADSGVDETTQNGSPTKSATGNGSGGVSRIPKKTPPSTPNRGRGFEQRTSGQRPPVRSKSVPKPFTSYGLTPVSLDDSASPSKKGKFLGLVCKFILICTYQKYFYWTFLSYFWPLQFL